MLGETQSLNGEYAERKKRMLTFLRKLANFLADIEKNGCENPKNADSTYSTVSQQN